MSADDPPVTRPPRAITERFDPIECLDERSPSPARRRRDPLEPGRYLEVQGPERALTIPRRQRRRCASAAASRADLRLDDTSVSRRHAILAPRPAGARILDDRSSNGTYVNGRRVQQADLRNGDVIVIGRVVLRYLEVPDRG